ncbi:MAG: helix-turn-helix domain-containing protein [Pseudonocardia sp.]
MTSADINSAPQPATPIRSTPTRRTLGQLLPERPTHARRFYSVAEVAEISGISSVTLYRAINAGEFPAVRVRGRVIVPARVLDALIEGAVDAGSVVDAASFVVTRREDGGS